jgi:hypothetical protein
MTKPKPTTTTNPATGDNDSDDYAALKTPGALAAFTYQKYGEEVLRLTFPTESVLAQGREGFEAIAKEFEAAGLDEDAARMRNAKPCAREDLEDTAQELEARGLNAVAAIMYDIAAQCPSGLDRDNPYAEGETYIGADGVEYPNLNWSEWRRNWLRRRREQTGELSADLRRYHAHKQQ